jgi:cytochrome b561
MITGSIALTQTCGGQTPLPAFTCYDSLRYLLPERILSEVLKYGATAKWLHWLVAFLVILMLIFGPGLEDMPLDQKEQTVMGHSGLGTLVLVLMLIRWPWRLTHKPPGPTSTMARWQIGMSHAMHWGLYVLIPLQVIFGILQAMYITDYNVVAFGLIDYSSWAADDKGLARIFHICHGVNSKLLMLLILGHFGVSLYHHFIQKDVVLKRMLPFGKVESD